MLRRDVVPGTSHGRMYMTLDGTIVIRWVALMIYRSVCTAHYVGVHHVLQGPKGQWLQVLTSGGALSCVEARRVPPHVCHAFPVACGCKCHMSVPLLALFAAATALFNQPHQPNSHQPQQG